MRGKFEKVGYINHTTFVEVAAVTPIRTVAVIELLIGKNIEISKIHFPAEIQIGFYMFSRLPHPATCKDCRIVNVHGAAPVEIAALTPPVTFIAILHRPFVCKGREIYKIHGQIVV